MARLTVSAVDLGAESGRVARVDFNGTTMELSVVRRFPNQPHQPDGRARWDVGFLWSEFCAGLKELGDSATVTSVGVDTFGVDYGLFDAQGELVQDPLTYREAGRSEAFDRVVKFLNSEQLYQQTGTQVAPINSIFALAADQQLRPEVLADASEHCGRA